LAGGLLYLFLPKIETMPNDAKNQMREVTLENLKRNHKKVLKNRPGAENSYLFMHGLLIAILFRRLRVKRSSTRPITCTSVARGRRCGSTVSSTISSRTDRGYCRLSDLSRWLRNHWGYGYCCWF